jgi:tetratricopeptide (TPR) repeat protein
LVEDGHCDPQTEARLMDVYASVLMDQRQLAEAIALLEKLHHHYLQYGETHLAGRALIKKGTALHADEHHQRAVDALRGGLAALRADKDPKLLAVGRHTLILALVEAGRFSEAGQLLMESGLRHAFADDPLNLLKLRGVEAKIFAGLGKLRRAEQIFTEVKKEFLVHHREYLVAMVNLELAAVLLRQGRPNEVEPLAEEALEIFRGLGVGREALKALRYLREACRQKVATVEIVQQVTRFLSRLERQPELRFSP